MAQNGPLWVASTRTSLHRNFVNHDVLKGMWTTHNFMQMIDYSDTKKNMECYEKLPKDSLQEVAERYKRLLKSYGLLLKLGFSFDDKL